MGNLIKDFWTYQYKGKSYFGINEVVRGEDLAQKRNEIKYESHIEKILKYTEIPGRKVMSHMSLQSYCTFLNINNRTIRDDKEDSYYPFVIEFEAEKIETYYGKINYPKVVSQAIRYIEYLIYELGVNEDDIVPMINNSRSIYVFVNPRAYNLKPSCSLHNIYRKIYEAIDEKIGLDHVCKSIFSSYKLIKTPNCYYKGGYFVRISLQELKELYKNPDNKSKLTASKRTMNVNVPGELANGLERLYSAARDDELQWKKAVKQITYIKKENCRCVEHMENYKINEGCRNDALVSIAICKKNMGYTEDQVIDIVSRIAEDWDHDENARNVASKVRSIYRQNYRFSCKYVKEAMVDLNMDELCSSCMYGCQKRGVNKTHISINAEIIKELWANNAGTRHYMAYLRLLEKDLINTWFNPEEHDLDDRVIRELCGYSSKLVRDKDKKKKLIYITPTTLGNIYKLPIEFFDSCNLLGDHIKHYLMLIIKSYKTFNKYKLLRVSKGKIMEDLGYKSMRGVNSLLQRLQETNFLIQKRNKVMCLYHEPYKTVIDIEEYKESIKEKEAEHEAYTSIQNNKDVVNYSQISFDGTEQWSTPWGRSLPRQKVMKNSLSNRGSPG